MISFFKVYFLKVHVQYILKWAQKVSVLVITFVKFNIFLTFSLEIKVLISFIFLYLHETFGPPHSWLASWNPVIINAAKSKACRKRYRDNRKISRISNANYYNCHNNVIPYQQSDKVLVITKKEGWRTIHL